MPPADTTTPLALVAATVATALRKWATPGRHHRHTVTNWRNCRVHLTRRHPAHTSNQ